MRLAKTTKDIADGIDVDVQAISAQSIGKPASDCLVGFGKCHSVEATGVRVPSKTIDRVEKLAHSVRINFRFHFRVIPAEPTIVFLSCS